MIIFDNWDEMLKMMLTSYLIMSKFILVEFIGWNKWNRRNTLSFSIYSKLKTQNSNEMLEGHTRKLIWLDVKLVLTFSRIPIMPKYWSYRYSWSDWVHTTKFTLKDYAEGQIMEHFRIEIKREKIKNQKGDHHNTISSIQSNHNPIKSLDCIISIGLSLSFNEF